MTIEGTVTIEGTKKGRPSQRLTFHQNGLKITGASIIRHDKKGDQAFEVTRINHQKTLDEVRLHAAQQLFPGTYTVTLHFKGKITPAMDGIYPCNFKLHGEKKMLIATQFESHHARNAFPCIDEPEAKATFDLTLVSPLNETALSNTPVKNQNGENGKLITTFETTPRMSTYLLAFAYGELGFKEAKTKRGVTVRAYATPDNVPHLDFAVDFAAKCLDFYEEYFAIPFPLEKCDFVALPDFASGAMENWGLITFREHALLVDPANTPLPTKQYIAMVIAHELTHQWFGNLVTMRWWTDLWLNEGFASWMCYLPLDHHFPDWHVWTQFVTDEQQIAFKFDSLANTHPVQVPINDPEEISTIFDVISYDKGASSIRMLEHYLGADTFRDGVRHYLKTHAYENTDTVDLWDALEKISGKPVKAFMAAWIEQAGYPLLRADISDNEARLVQEQFLLNPLERQKTSLTKTLWPISLEADRGLPELFDKPEAVFSYKKSERPLKLNIGQSGLFRVVYNASHLQLLGEQIAAGKLDATDRLGLLADVFEAAKAGYCDTTLALQLLESYRDEYDSAVWDVIAAQIASVKGVMNDDELREDMKPYVRALVTKQLARLSWEARPDEPYLDSLLRPTILSLASAADETSVVDEALRRFKAMKRPQDLPPDVRGVIYDTAARHGDVQTFEKMLAMHNESTSSEERLTLSAALTNFEQPELYKRALSIIDTDAVRIQDAMYWIAYSFGNRFARKATWEWLVEHWGWIKTSMGTDLAFSRFPIYAARAFSDASFLPTYKAFFESVMSPMLQRTFKQGVEIIEWQSEWKKRDLALIKTFFKEKKL